MQPKKLRNKRSNSNTDNAQVILGGRSNTFSAKLNKQFHNFKPSIK